MSDSSKSLALILLLGLPLLAFAERPSSDRRYHWTEGQDFVLLTDAPGKKPRKISLPANKAKPSRRTVLFAGNSRYFCLLETRDREFGLHLDLPRGARNAKALLMESTLSLLDDAGTILWRREMPQNTSVSGAGAGATARAGEPEKAAARMLRISNNGTLAILLQDVDPYDKARPVLAVIDSSGKERLLLDYTTWAKVEQFALAGNGKTLALWGFGHLPQEDTWSKGFGFYEVSSGKKWVLPSPFPGEPALSAVDDDGWACCLKNGRALYALNREGKLLIPTSDQMKRRFGAAP